MSSNHRVTICCAGEVMVELAANAAADSYVRGVAGDSYNTAVYLSRAGFAVHYLTRLGDDHMSDAIVAAMDAEHIATTLVARCQGRQPGIYLIDNDAHGERNFTYWRENSPARQLFAAQVDLPPLDLFYFTGITVAVARQGMANLIDTLAILRGRGCAIAFDPNYREALWDSAAQAQEHYRAITPLCDIVMPTLEDDRQLMGIDNEQDCARHYLDLGAHEVVVKGDALLNHVATQVATGVTADVKTDATTGMTRPTESFTLRAKQLDAVDTTGAGDAFNAGYLGARLSGKDVALAVEQAQQLAAKVVQHRGAILPSTH